MTRLRNFSYSHDQDHVHIHSNVILLHWKIASISIHHKIKLQVIPWPPLSPKLPSGMWAIQKEKKDAYPKKICHWPTRHVKKKRREEEEEKYIPYQKYYKGERNHIKEFRPPSTKKKIYIHTLAHLDQGLWLVSPLDPVFDLAKYEKQACHYILHTYRSTKKSH